LLGNDYLSNYSKKTVEELANEWENYRKNFQNYEAFLNEIQNLTIEGPSFTKITKKLVKLLEKCLEFAPPGRPSFDKIKIII